MDFVIDSYSFTTTSVPSSPAMQIVSNGSTYYVDLTTSSRPEFASTFKIFVYTDSDHPYLRPFVTYNSLMGYIGSSSSSTQGQSYDSCYGNTTYYASNTVVPNASSLNSISLSNMTNWVVESTNSTNTGTHMTTSINQAFYSFNITNTYTSQTTNSNYSTYINSVNYILDITNTYTQGVY